MAGFRRSTGSPPAIPCGARTTGARNLSNRLFTHEITLCVRAPLRAPPSGQEAPAHAPAFPRTGSPQSTHHPALLPEPPRHPRRGGHGRFPARRRLRPGVQRPLRPVPRGAALRHPRLAGPSAGAACRHPRRGRPADRCRGRPPRRRPRPHGPRHPARPRRGLGPDRQRAHPPARHPRRQPDGPPDPLRDVRHGRRPRRPPGLPDRRRPPPSRPPPCGSGRSRPAPCSPR